jgi:hypothetical protein
LLLKAPAEKKKKKKKSVFGEQSKKNSKHKGSKCFIFQNARLFFPFSFAFSFDIQKV